MLISFDSLIRDHGVNPKGIVHIGAHECEERVGYNSGNISDEKIIWIEGQKTLCDKISKSVPNIRIYNLVVSDQDDKEVNFIVTNNYQSSSIPELKDHKKFYPHIVEVERSQVKTKTLDAFLFEQKEDMRQYNFLCVNIQGAELLALKGATKFLEYLEYLHLGVNTSHLYKDCALMSEIDDFLRPFGFERKAISITDQNCGDALYVKNRYNTGLVSVIIPSYQRFDSLKIAINSVLVQTYKNIELIVIDDCSPDSRYKQLDEMFPTVKFIHLPFNVKQKFKVNAPQGETRMQGCAGAKGEFIAFLDDDDAWIDKKKIELQVNMLRKYPEHKLCSSDMLGGIGTYFEGIKGKSIHNYTPNLKLEEGVYSIDLQEIRRTNNIANSTVVVDHKLFDQTGAMKAENTEDYNCWKRLMVSTNALYLKSFTSYYDLNHAGAQYYRYT